MLISNSNAPQDIAANDNYIRQQLALKAADIQIHEDVYIRAPIIVNDGKPFRIIGITPNARLISYAAATPLQINSIYPGSYNPPATFCDLWNFTFLHQPSDNGAYSHLIAGGTNIGKYLRIRDLTVSHFTPLIKDKKFADIPSVFINQSAGLNLHNLYCHCLNTGGLYLFQAYKATLINYIGRLINNGRPLKIEQSSVVTGDIYCESYNQPLLFNSVQECQGGITMWLEGAGWPDLKIQYAMEVLNSEINFYGNYPQECCLDAFSYQMCQLNDQPKPFGDPINAYLLGYLTSWDSSLVSISTSAVATTIVATQWANNTGAALHFPTNNPNFKYKVGDRFFASGNINLDPVSKEWFINQIKAGVDLPLFRASINDVGMGQNVYVTPQLDYFSAEGIVLQDGSNPELQLVFFGSPVTSPLVTPLTLRLSNVSLRYSTS